MPAVPREQGAGCEAGGGVANGSRGRSTPPSPEPTASETLLRCSVNFRKDLQEKHFTLHRRSQRLERSLGFSLRGKPSQVSLSSTPASQPASRQLQGGMTFPQGKGVPERGCSRKAGPTLATFLFCLHALGGQSDHVTPWPNTCDGFPLPLGTRPHPSRRLGELALAWSPASCSSAPGLSCDPRDLPHMARPHAQLLSPHSPGPQPTWLAPMHPCPSEWHPCHRHDCI